MPAYGDQDGFGRYGMLEEVDDGLTCHECGQPHQHLGLHVARAHGSTAAQYRIMHGLKRSRGLVVASIRAKQVENGQRIAASPSGIALVEARDPGRAAKIWRELGMPVSPEAARERDERASAMGKGGRKGQVLTCRFCGCTYCVRVGGASRRKFCSRSCASKATRRARSAGTGHGSVNLD